MKIRTGFVSNSSSSSFMIRGIELTDELVDLLFIGHDKEKEKFLELYNNDEEEYKDLWYISENLNKYLKSLDISLETEYSNNEYSSEEPKIFIGKIVQNDLSSGDVVEIENFNDVDFELTEKFDKINPDILNKSKLKLYMQYSENH